MDWIVAHWEELLALFAALHVAAGVIVNLTPTPKDDELLKKAYGVVEVFAGLITKKAKQ